MTMDRRSKFSYRSNVGVSAVVVAAVVIYLFNSFRCARIPVGPLLTEFAQSQALPKDYRSWHLEPTISDTAVCWQTQDFKAATDTNLVFHSYSLDQLTEQGISFRVDSQSDGQYHQINGDDRYQLSPDGRNYACLPDYFDGPSQVMVLDSHTARQKALVVPGNSVVCGVWIDNNTLLVSSFVPANPFYYMACLVSLDTRTPVVAVREPGQQRLRWISAGSRYAFATEMNNSDQSDHYTQKEEIWLYRMDLKDPSHSIVESRIAPPVSPGLGSWRMLPSPDGQHIAFEMQLFREWFAFQRKPPFFQKTVISSCTALYIAQIDGSNPHLIGILPQNSSGNKLAGLAWSTDSSSLRYIFANRLYTVSAR